MPARAAENFGKILGYRAFAKFLQAKIPFLSRPPNTSAQAFPNFFFGRFGRFQ
jgi:hypothetical protein